MHGFIVAMLDLRVLLPETAIADQLAAAFRARHLPEKLFYCSPLSVRAWLDLCGQGPYRNFSRSHQLVQRFAGHPKCFPAGPLEVWSLGPGNAEKDLLLLRTLRERGDSPAYRAVDVSLGLLETACAAVATEGFPVRGFKADVGDPAHREALRGAPGDPPRLVLLLGNMLGAFDPLLFAGPLGDFLRPEDRLLVDGEVGAGADTLAGYDNPINRRFAFAPLAGVGLTEADGELRFDLVADPRRPGLTCVTKHFRARRDLSIQLAGKTLVLSAGETVTMSGSHKYAPGDFAALLRDVAGLEIEREETTEDGRYAMALARKPATGQSG